MKNIVTTLTTEAIFSDDCKKRYLLKKTWNNTEPNLAIIMLAPSDASGIVLDLTTQLVINNADTLGFGSISIVNLSATIDDFSLKKADDEEIVKTMLDVFKSADTIIYAPGVGKAKNKQFQQLQADIAVLLKPYEDKLKCLCDSSGSNRLQHPLSPAVRTWYLSPLSTFELLPEQTQMQEKSKQKIKKIKS